jgi:hypothetical protein
MTADPDPDPPKPPARSRRLPTREELQCSVCRADTAPFLIGDVPYCLKHWKEAGGHRFLSASPE